MSNRLIQILTCAAAISVLHIDTISGQRHAADSLINIAQQYIGCKYKYGATGPNTFDCSGFTKYIYHFFNYDLTRSAASQSHDGREIALTDLQKGDILLYGARKNPHVVGHVGIFIEKDATNGSFTFIHAAHNRVKISNSEETYYKQRLLGARRILRDFSDTQNDNEEATTHPVKVVVALSPQIIKIPLITCHIP